MSVSAISAVLSDRSSTGVIRLALLAIADAGGEASISAIERWCNVNEVGAMSLLHEMAQLGVIEEYHCDDTCTIRYRSEWLENLTNPPSIKPSTPNRYIPERIRTAVYQRDDFTCQYCGETEGDMHIDHVHPISRGGTSEIENLKVACAPCNLSKRAKTIDEWGGRA